MTRSKGNRARFTKKALEKPRSALPILLGSDQDGGCEVVQLHGDLQNLRCTLCQKKCNWEEGREDTLLAGVAPECSACRAADCDRRDRGKRGTAVGRLRPNIVLYGEEHPSADMLSQITTHDLRLTPDVLLVLGTSLKVHGLKIMVKEFAKAVHARAGGKGKVIFVNLTKPPESVWNGVLDYHIAMDCDAWVEDLRVRRPDVWHQQGELKLPITKRVNTKQITATNMKPQFAKGDEDKENAQALELTRNLATPIVEGELITPLSKSLKRSFSSEETPSKRPKHLPTPPSSGRKPLYEYKALRTPAFALNENFRPSTPSKRRKTSIAVWEDAEASPGLEIPNSEEDELSYDEKCIVMGKRVTGF